MCEKLYQKIAEQKLGEVYENKRVEYDFALHKELTVEITLAEYRNLIKSVAEMSKEKSDWNYKMSQKIGEIDKLKKENDKLKEQFLKSLEGQKEE